MLKFLFMLYQHIIQEGKIDFFCLQVLKKSSFGQLDSDNSDILIKIGNI